MCPTSPMEKFVKTSKNTCSNFSKQAQIAAPQHHSLNACTGSIALVAGPNLHLAHAAAFSEGHRGRGVVLFAGAPILPGAFRAVEISTEKTHHKKHQEAKGGFSSWGRLRNTIVTSTLSSLLPVACCLHPSFFLLLGSSPSVMKALDEPEIWLQSDVTEGVLSKARLLPVSMSPGMQNGGCTPG